MAFTKATFDYLDSGGLINWITTAKTSAFTAVSGEGYLVDTSSAAVTVTLPTSPSAGDEIIIVDYASNAGTNNITLDPGTLNLRGATDDFVMSTNDQSVRLLYSGATKGWLVTSDAGAGAASTPALTVDYLVIAGGGGASVDLSGGAGAGGLRTSYGSTSGGGASAESGFALDTGTNYTVTVGSGGAGASGIGSNGSNSVFSTITSTGGGGGSQGTTYTSGANGGSGGGASRGNGSGGGAGGNGLAVSITGSSVTYAGGGGGGGYYANGGSGGSGGGGKGGDNNATNNAANGTANTGGGAGGGEQNASQSRSGGSGVVILRYPDAYTITVGSGLTASTATDGSDKVTTFTAGTGSVSFSA